jgi:hypothetical protein
MLNFFKTQIFKIEHSIIDNSLNNDKVLRIC